MEPKLKAWGGLTHRDPLWIHAVELSWQKIRKNKNVTSLTTEIPQISFLNGTPETITHPHAGLNLHFFHIISCFPENFVFSSPFCFHKDYPSQVVVLKAFTSIYIIQCFKGSSPLWLTILNPLPYQDSPVRGRVSLVSPTVGDKAFSESSSGLMTGWQHCSFGTLWVGWAQNLTNKSLCLAEPWNHWRRSLRPPSPTIKPSPPC